jgi:ferredoxin
MILYFSGTGNSRFAAEALGKELGDSTLSLNDCLRTKKTRNFTSDQPFIIVAPVYASRMPREIEEYLKRCRFYGSRDVWFLLTCGGGMGGAADYCKKIAQDRGLIYHGTSCIAMPNNYVLLTDVISPKEAKVKAAEVLPEIRDLATCIKDGKEFAADRKFTSLKGVSAFADLFHLLLIKDTAFHADEKCIGCGKCERLCPLRDITLKSGKPVWNGKCMHCMACISACPVKAINYGNKTQNRNRYYLAE